MIDPKYIEQIPVMREDAAQLLRLVNEIVSSRLGPYEGNDFLGAMIDVFMHKQIGHLRSICVLVVANQTPDALIIARSAYENMIRLMWAAFGPAEENLAHRWFLLEVKDDYFNEYQHLNPETREARIQNVLDYADEIQTPKGKEKLQRGESLCNSDFTVKKLPSIRDMLEAEWLKGKVLQTEPLNGKDYLLYQILSQWPHGTPKGMKMVFRHDGNSLLQDAPISKYLGGCAIVLGIQSLYKTANLFDEHFKLNFHDELVKFGNKHVL